ncbi:MAG: hypothetical protein MUP98_20950 [Candidatus Aminicenantes bacterium]|nr:hypothetical protein [Candidatus Aminicenantes bacterium]
MSKSLKKLVFGILLVASLSLVGLAADISGTWAMTITTQRGEMESEMTIAQDGEKIKVTMEGFQGDEMIGEGTFKDNKAEWSVTVSTPNGDFTISYKGTLEEETLSGEAEMGDFGTMEWTAKKK